MTCRSLPVTEDAIVEVARGREVGRGTAAAVASHVETCEGCAARLARERRVSEALRALAAATASAAPSAALERRLMAACAGRKPAAQPHWLALAAAAAAIVVAVVLWRSATTPPAQPQTEPIARSTPAIDRPAEQPRPTAAAVSAGNTAARRHRGSRASTTPAAVNDGAFIVLPAAIGLPDFESGVIVRMELPQAALPAYGLEIVPGAKMPVEADLLIGQDGQARAIRLVNRSLTRSGAEQ
jgi:hypothetical protein